MSRPITLTRGSWRFLWEGGRTADVYHVSKREYPLDCVQVGDDPEVDPPFTRESLRAAAREWVRDNAADFTRELAYL